MRVQFDDGTYVELKVADDPDKLLLIVSAIDQLNNKKKVINAAEMTKEQFKKLISDVQI